MFKAHTDYPLHLAIQHQREDVVFLFLIEYNSQVWRERGGREGGRERWREKERELAYTCKIIYIIYMYTKYIST